MKKTIKTFIKKALYKNKINIVKSKLKDRSYEDLKQQVLNYIKSLNGNKIYLYSFSKSSNSYNLYSSVYAILLLGLFDEIKNISINEREEWANYILSFQDKDGMFRDEQLETHMSENGHSWGWYHLLPHVLIALDYLDRKPKYDFTKILSIFDNKNITTWLIEREWIKNPILVSNEIMNIGVALQYSRDYFENQKAKKIVDELKNWLIDNEINNETGLWGLNSTVFNAVKTTYHILPIFIYDKDVPIDINKVIDNTLLTENSVGGFSPNINANACEDIDSLYILSMLQSSDIDLTRNVDKVIQNHLKWIYVNQNNDGGFVFTRYSKFQYGDQNILSSKKDESNIFATWFRTLSIAFALKTLNSENEFLFSKTPGYQFYVKL
jgi:prenyltransferase beta subunit